ncbi:MAG: glycosyltransferase [Limisphaerales bacterium]
MKHLHFTQSIEPLQGGGLGSSTTALHRQMLSSGLSSALCATRAVQTGRSLPGVLEFPRLKPDFAYYSPALQRQAPQLVNNCDVLHGHGLYVGTNFIFGREARRQGKPLVYHVHGFFEPYILQRSRWKKQLVHWLFEDENFRRIRLWRALTDKEAGQIRSRGIKAPIVVVPNGLNADDYRQPGVRAEAIATPLIPELKKSSRRVLFLSRIHPKKGLDLLFPAWSRVRPKTLSWELVIAGPDEGGYLKEMRELAASLKLESQVQFTGEMTGAAKKALLSSADVFVLPSYSEGFSMSLLEALACGVPVAATRACNFPEISHAEAGWECETTVESLAAALLLAMESSDLERRQRGENGRELVEKYYAWPRIVETLAQACAAHC